MSHVDLIDQMVNIFRTVDNEPPTPKNVVILLKNFYHINDLKSELENESDFNSAVEYAKSRNYIEEHNDTLNITVLGEYIYDREINPDWYGQETVNHINVSPDTNDLIYTIMQNDGYGNQIYKSFKHENDANDWLSKVNEFKETKQYLLDKTSEIWRNAMESYQENPKLSLDENEAHKSEYCHEQLRKTLHVLDPEFYDFYIVQEQLNESHISGFLMTDYWIYPNKLVE